jgi:hypothetical protein
MTLAKVDRKCHGVGQKLMLKHVDLSANPEEAPKPFLSTLLDSMGKLGVKAQSLRVLYTAHGIAVYYALPAAMRASTTRTRLLISSEAICSPEKDPRRDPGPHRRRGLTLSDAQYFCVDSRRSILYLFASILAYLIIPFFAALLFALEKRRLFFTSSICRCYNHMRALFCAGY